MKIVFMGTPDFASEVLKSLLESEHQVLAVFTQPDKPRGRGKKISYTPVKEMALEAQIPIYQPRRIRDEENLEILKQINPDVIIVAAYGNILPKEILDLPPYGCINIHASILPKYRGAAPIHWAIIKGETETGISIMQMDEGMDTGDVLLLERIEISEEADTGEIFAKLASLGSKMIIEVLEKIKDGKLIPVKQKEEEATYAPMLTKKDELLDWDMSSKDIYNKIRGMNPWPGVYTYFRGDRLKIQKSILIDEKQVIEYKPGEIIDFSEEGIFIAANPGTIALKIIQPAGKKQLNFKDFINGYQISRGELLGKQNGK